MVKGLPQSYVFMLLPRCKYEQCPHPICKDKVDGNESTWFPSGPPLRYFPLPIPDPKRPWGGLCKQCKGFCAGHYLPPEENLKHYKLHGKKEMQMKPPSVVITEANKDANDNGRNLSEDDKLNLAKKTLLTIEDVELWLKHISDVSTRRKEGAKKAAETRRKKKANQNGGK